MERIEAYRTDDGKIFTEKRLAAHHVENLMGAIVTRHAAKLAQIDKYTATIDYLLSALPELAAARELQIELEDATRKPDLD